jgi:prolyl-tRNA synthetase
MQADTGPIGGDLSHEFIVLASTGESAVFCHKRLPRPSTPAEDTDFEDVGGLQGDRRQVDVASTPRPRRCTTRPPSRRCRRTSASRRAASKSATSSTSAPSTPNRWARRSPGRTASRAPVMAGPTASARAALVAALIEAGHDDAGIVWPDEIAPFDVAVINLKVGDAGTDAACEQLYGSSPRGYDVLYDDTDNRPGGKFATADLIGLPWQIIVGPKGLEKARSSSSAAPVASANCVSLGGGAQPLSPAEGMRPRDRRRRRGSSPPSERADQGGRRAVSPASNGCSPGAICARAGARASSRSSPASPSSASCSASRR